MPLKKRENKHNNNPSLNTPRNPLVITLVLAIVDLGLRVGIVLLLLLGFLGFGGLGVTHLDILILILILLLLVSVVVGGRRRTRELDVGRAAEAEVAAACATAALLSAPESVASLSPFAQLLLVARLKLLFLRVGQVLPAARKLLLQAELAGGNLVFVLLLEDGPHVVAVDLERIARALGGLGYRVVAVGRAAAERVAMRELGAGREAAHGLADEGWAGGARLTVTAGNQRVLPMTTLDTERLIFRLFGASVIVRGGIGARGRLAYSRRWTGTSFRVLDIGTCSLLDLFQQNRALETQFLDLTSQSNCA